MRKTVSLLLSITLIIFFSIHTSAAVPAYETQTNHFEQCKQRLSTLNKELGTNYVLAPGEGETQNDLIIFFSKMTLNEFDKYIRNAYENDKMAKRKMSSKTFLSPKKAPDVSIKAAPIKKKQRYYFSTNQFFYVEAYINKIAGSSTYVYTGQLGKTGVHNGKTYPAYKVSDNPVKISFSNEHRCMTCKWTYYKMVSQGVYDATKYTIKYIHTAGGGDLYPST